MPEKSMVGTHLKFSCLISLLKIKVNHYWSDETC